VSRSSLRISLVPALGCCGLAMAGAQAQEYCVACKEPPAVYRCVIEGARPGGPQPLQVLCVEAMTKQGRHVACGLKGGTVFDCDGPVRRVPWAAYQGAAKPVAEAPPAPAKAPDEPPRTVEEAIKRANAKTGEQLKEANETVKGQTQALGRGFGEATRKTWQCLASLFTRCGE
jgi:hypothetical protein